MTKYFWVPLALMVGAFGALAHEGVKNPAVMARMDAMSAVGAATKVLGQMAKGEVAFDAAKAEAALVTLSEKAAAVPVLFEANENDPKSEARPEIWFDFATFMAEAQAMEAAAKSAMGQMKSQADVGPALARIGVTCKNCHKAFRE